LTFIVLYFIVTYTTGMPKLKIQSNFTKRSPTLTEPPAIYYFKQVTYPAAYPVSSIENCLKVSKFWVCDQFWIILLKVHSINFLECGKALTPMLTVTLIGHDWIFTDSYICVVYPSVK